MDQQDRTGPQDPTDLPGPAVVPDTDEEVPFGQRLFDRPFVLLGLGLVIMLAFYTGWGLWEVASLSEAPLP